MRTILAALFVLAVFVPARAADGPPAAPRATDLNIVTAIDGSDSVSQGMMRRQLAALAAALRDPALVAAIRSGRAGRIGFALFVWHTERVDVVPWTLIATARDAEEVARALEARMEVNLFEEAWRGRVLRLTDLSTALEHACDLSAIAPFASSRTVVNVIGNGSDNMGEPVVEARRRLLARGATINGVVFAPDAALITYFRSQVAGGRGAFVLPADADAPMVELMRRKLMGDLLLAAI